MEKKLVGRSNGNHQMRRGAETERHSAGSPPGMGPPCSVTGELGTHRQQTPAGMEWVLTKDHGDEPIGTVVDLSEDPFDCLSLACWSFFRAVRPRSQFPPCPVAKKFSAKMSKRLRESRKTPSRNCFAITESSVSSPVPCTSEASHARTETSSFQKGSTSRLRKAKAIWSTILGVVLRNKGLGLRTKACDFESTD